MAWRPRSTPGRPRRRARDQRARTGAGDPLDHIDERAPNAASCRFDLQAEYRPAEDGLWLRRELIGYDLRDGRCELRERRWSELEPLARVGRPRGGPEVTDPTPLPVWPMTAIPSASLG